MAPQPVTPWTGTLETTWVRNSCVQPHDAFTLFPQESEDCLCTLRGGGGGEPSCVYWLCVCVCVCFGGEGGGILCW